MEESNSSRTASEIEDELMIVAQARRQKNEHSGQRKISFREAAAKLLYLIAQCQSLLRLLWFEHPA
eukprot:scaffold609_cov130-Cylindrotheca_fusiformis.AAC.20